jgi:hypothetical protein
LHNWRRDHWNPAVRAAGLEHGTPYALRHTYASFAIAAGVSLFELARFMGASVEQIPRTPEGHAAWATATRLVSARLGAEPPASAVYNQVVEAVLNDLASAPAHHARRDAGLLIAALTELALMLVTAGRTVEIDVEAGTIRGREKLLDFFDALFEDRYRLEADPDERLGAD